MTKIIFLCGVWRKENENIILNNSIGGIQSAANVFQNNIIEGLDINLRQPLILLNEVFVGSFPRRYKKAYVRGGEWNHSLIKHHIDYNIEFLNLPLIKHSSRLQHSKKYIRKVCNEDIILIGYSMTYSIVKALTYAKRYNPNIKTCLIIPDLPEYMNLGKRKNSIINLIKSMVTKRLYHEIKKIDSFVILTKYMLEKLHVKKPYIVVEGIASEIDSIMPLNNNFEKKNIVYTGSLAQKYGVIDLVEAFEKIEGEELQLIICGSGDAAEYIKQASARDNRIKYMGTVSNAEARIIQANAYLLVNPRNNKEEYTKYSFPSKTMEYMATGRPVLMYKLKGIPDEYDEFLYYINENMGQSIQQVLLIESWKLAEKGEKARRFVLEKKNKEIQCKRIIDFLYSLD